MHAWTMWLSSIDRVRGGPFFCHGTFGKCVKNWPLFFVTTITQPYHLLSVDHTYIDLSFIFCCHIGDIFGGCFKTFLRCTEFRYYYSSRSIMGWCCLQGHVYEFGQGICNPVIFTNAPFTSHTRARVVNNHTRERDACTTKLCQA